MSLELEIDVPENRTVTLPDSVPVGRVKVTVQPAMGVPPPPPGLSDKALRERAAFYRLLPELLKTHHGKVVAIHDERVIAAGEDRRAVIDEARRLAGYVDMYIAPVVDRRPRERVGGLREFRRDPA